MKEFACLDCDHNWEMRDSENCPKCGSYDIIQFDEQPDGYADDFDGHFEGDFPRHLFTDDGGDDDLC